VLDSVSSDVRLDRLPVVTCWPDDGGPFVTLPLVYTTHPDRPGHNLGMYRLQVHDRATTGMHWQIGKGGGFHYARAEARGQALPATVFLGGPPALILSAIAPLPENVPELMLRRSSPGSGCRNAGAGGHPHPDCVRGIRDVGEVATINSVPEGLLATTAHPLRHAFTRFSRSSRSRGRRDAIYPATIVGKLRRRTSSSAICSRVCCRRSSRW
jgi:hypothetical protein